MKIIDFLRNKTAKDSMLSLLGNGVAQVFSFLVTIVVSRSLSVAQYGVYCILNTIATFVSDMADMGMNGGITRFVAELRANNKLEEEHQLIGYAFKRKILNFVLMCIILLIGAKPIAAIWLKDSSMHYYIYLIIASCGIALMQGACSAIMQGRQQFGILCVSVVLRSFLWFALLLMMAVCGRLSVGSSIVAGVISGVIVLLGSMYLLRINIFKTVRSKIINEDTKKKFNNFGNWMMLWALCAILQSKLDVFMLATLTTSEQVSYYDIASKVIKPVLMVLTAYGQVLNPKFATSPVTEINKHVKNAAKVITVLTFGIIAGIILIRPAITIVFGSKYDMAIRPAQMLLFAIIFYAWELPFNGALYALNKPAAFTLAAFMGLVVTAIGNYFLLTGYGAVGAAFTYILAQIVGLVMAVGNYMIAEKAQSNKFG